MFQWKKLGLLPILNYERSLPWFNEFAQAPSSLIMKDSLRIYFSCRPPVDALGGYVSYSTWVDLDKKDIFKIKDIGREPIFQLGSTGQFDEFGIYPVSVIRYENEVRAYYAGWTRCESVPFNVAIGCGVSRDEGRTFNKMGSGPILGYSPEEPFVISGPKIRRFDNKWQLFYIAGRKWKLVNQRPEPVYKIRMAVSEDGINWIKLNKDLIPSRIEEDEAQASPDVFYFNGLYHMFFCYRYSENFRNKDRGYRIGYAYSNDLVNWIRDDSKAGIDVSPSGWDSEMISYPHIFSLEGEIYMAYLGNQVGRYGFGFAILEGSLG